MNTNLHISKDTISTSLQNHWHTEEAGNMSQSDVCFPYPFRLFISFCISLRSSPLFSPLNVKTVHQVSREFPFQSASLSQKILSDPRKLEGRACCFGWLERWEALVASSLLWPQTTSGMHAFTCVTVKSNVCWFNSSEKRSTKLNYKLPELWENQLGQMWSQYIKVTACY